MFVNISYGFSDMKLFCCK